MPTEHSHRSADRILPCKSYAVNSRILRVTALLAPASIAFVLKSTFSFMAGPSISLTRLQCACIL